MALVNVELMHECFHKYLHQTSISDHNIIQIETNLKIEEEKQNYKIKKKQLELQGETFSMKTSVGKVLMLTCSTQAGTRL